MFFISPNSSPSPRRMQGCFWAIFCAWNQMGMTSMLSCFLLLINWSVSELYWVRGKQSCSYCNISKNSVIAFIGSSKACAILKPNVLCLYLAYIVECFLFQAFYTVLYEFLPAFPTRLHWSPSSARTMWSCCQYLSAFQNSEKLNSWTIKVKFTQREIKAWLKHSSSSQN